MAEHPIVVGIEIGRRQVRLDVTVSYRTSARVRLS